MMDLKMEIYTPALDLVGILEVHRSVMWEEKAFSAGSFSVDSLITADSKRLLVPDNIIWIEGATAGIIEYFHEEAGPTGSYITVKGKTLTGILDHNILWGRYDLKGTAPQIMHTLVDDCCIRPTRGAVEARRIPGLVLLPPPAGGETIRTQKTGGSLLEALEQLGEAYGVSFGVRFDPETPQMEFWTRWGQDRSVGQSKNDPVFYSRELDDVLSSEYSYSSQDYRNVALVAGEGEGNDRVMVTVEEQVPEAPVPPAPAKYTITLSVDPTGGGEAAGGGEVDEGQSVTVIAAPANGFEFVGWRENGDIVSTSASYTFKPSTDRALTAVFAAIVPTYMITASIDPAGSGTVTGTGRYREGQQATLRAEPAEGYKFSGWAEGRPSKLPAGYTELEYIQSSGAQYIDTGFVPNSNTRIVSDFEAMDGPYQFVSIFGQRSSSNADGTFLFMQNGVFNAMYGTSYTSFDNDYDFSTQRHVCDFNKNVVTVSEKSVVLPISSFVGATSLTLFAVNTSGTKDLIGNVRCYSCKIFDNDSIVRDLVPCIGPSGAVGLYDVIGKSFYPNGGTGGFIAGPEVGKTIVNESDGYTFTVDKDRALVAMFEVKKTSRLPDGYTEREYIESDQSFGIDTGYHVDFSKTKIVLDIKAGDHVANNLEYIMGANFCYVSAFARYFYLFRNSSALMTRRHDKGGAAAFSLDITNKRLSIDWDLSNSRLDIGADFSAVTEKAAITMSTNLFLGASAGTTKSIEALWYSAKIYEDSTLLHDFVPCTDPTGEAGFYDLVSDRFYRNSWNGSITPGPAI